MLFSATSVLRFILKIHTSRNSEEMRVELQSSHLSSSSRHTNSAAFVSSQTVRTEKRGVPPASETAYSYEFASKAKKGYAVDLI